MSRKVTIWQLWDAEDAPATESFFATKTEMLATARKNYGCIGPGTPDAEHPTWLRWGENKLTKEVRDAGTFSITARPLEVEMSKEGVCRALQYYPSR